MPDAYEALSDTFGLAHIASFDKHKISYYTREGFDFFYPGYGSSYPSLMGSIGMLVEQGGHSRGGRAVETDDGYVSLRGNYQSNNQTIIFRILPIWGHTDKTCLLYTSTSPRDS